MSRFILSLSFIFTVYPAKAADLKNCGNDLSPPPSLAQAISTQTEKELKTRGFSSREARGYSILIATMVASAAATTYLSSSLPPNFQFVSHFLAQVSTLGVYVFGAPIWEPLSSGFRKMAFGVRKSGGSSKEGAGPELEDLWRRTQETYSLNEQMSRNVISQFLVSVHQNFYEAHRAMNSENPRYAADQVAEAAFRLRTLFREIPPRDPSVAAAVRVAFTNHIQVDQEFAGLVAEKIAALDRSYSSAPAKKFYSELFDSWLGLAL